VAEAEARILARRGYCVSVLTSACGATAGETSTEGVRVRRVSAWNGFEKRRGVPFPVFSPALLWHAWRMVRVADVVHIHDPLYLTSWVVAFACQVHSRPYVVTAHVAGIVFHRSTLVCAVQAVVLNTLAAAVLHGARAIVAVNSYVSEHVRTSRPVGVLSNGVDLERYRPPDDNDERVKLRIDYGLPTDGALGLFVGRFVPKKGIDIVLAAESPSYQLVFVGDEPPTDLPADTTHLFLGRLAPEDVAKVYRAASFFICASIGEVPLVVVEAMASGLPVLLHQETGYREIGSEGGVRLLDMAGGGLRAAIEQLISDPDELQRMSRSSASAAARWFSWEAHVDELSSIYHTLLQT
jgi:glycosyltransferase involved in cell wall biosynthesis